MFFGDSFVAGAGDPEGLGWVGRVTAAAWAAGAPLTPYNLGVRGESSTEVVARIPAEAAPRIAPRADCRLVLSFGANDATLQNGRPRVDPDRSVAVLEEALGLGPRAFVVGPPPANDAAHADRIAALSERFALVCERRSVPYVPVVGELRRTGPWLAEARAGDGAHPSAGGYAQLAALVREPFLAWLCSDTL